MSAARGDDLAVWRVGGADGEGVGVLAVQPPGVGHGAGLFGNRGTSQALGHHLVRIQPGVEHEYRQVITTQRHGQC
jgi:hypothetical protein